MSDIDSYLQNISPSQRQEFERIRLIVMRLAPDAKETISYGIPTFSVNDKPLVHFGVFKNHISIFPTSHPTQVLKDKLKDFKVSRGTVRFTLDNPLPEKVIKDMLLVRLTDIYKQ